MVIKNVVDWWWQKTEQQLQQQECSNGTEISGNEQVIIVRITVEMV